METIPELAKELGDLLERKEKAYGSSFSKTEEFLTLLYPNGISTKDYRHMLVLVRIFDKMMRIATNGDTDPMAETPAMDSAGYFLLHEFNLRKLKQKGIQTLSCESTI